MDDERPTFGSLFAGIGGIDLGLERAGWQCRFQVEWAPFCQRVLAKHWPDVPRYGDIAAIDWSGVERVDLLAGGFPCQPVSGAGKGQAQDDERWLWPEFDRAIRALRPRLVLVENVPNLLAINGGSAFGEVVGDLAASGYDAEWDCIPAAVLGAPHLRDRVWVVAYARGSGREVAGHAGDNQETDGGWQADQPSRNGHPSTLADAGSARQSWLQGRPAHGLLDWRAGFGRDGGDRRADPRWSVEPDVGRVAHGVPSRVDRLRSLGNAVVPQVVEMIGTQLLASLRAIA